MQILAAFPNRRGISYETSADARIALWWAESLKKWCKVPFGTYRFYISSMSKIFTMILEKQRLKKVEINILFQIKEWSFIVNSTCTSNDRLTADIQLAKLVKTDIPGRNSALDLNRIVIGSCRILIQDPDKIVYYHV